MVLDGRDCFAVVEGDGYVIVDFDSEESLFELYSVILGWIDTVYSYAVEPRGVDVWFFGELLEWVDRLASIVELYGVRDFQPKTL